MVGFLSIILSSPVHYGVSDRHYQILCFILIPLFKNLLNLTLTFNTGYQSSTVAQSMRACRSDGPLVANVVKLFNTPDGNKFLALARIYSGSVSVGQRVRVLGEGFSQVQLGLAARLYSTI
jgi:translation elongation factor EF-G